MERTSAPLRTVPSAATAWIRAVLLVAAAVLALGVAPRFEARASAAVAPRHAQSYGPSTPKPAKTAHKGAAVARAQVKISNFKFGPRTLTVRVGTKVTWTNHDAIAHSVNFSSGKVNSKTLDDNATYSRTFTTPGTYAYICAIHPFMHGTVVVTA
jgi:amicyanin